MPWPKSKKCISCPVDIDDLKVLGARYADDGFVLAALFDWSPGPWKETWEVDGQVIGINLDCVHDLDRRVKRMSELGMNMTLIPINGVPTEPAPANPLIHPRTDLAHAPYHLGAFNLIDNMATAHVTNCLAWRPGWADGHGGLLYPTILQHPLAPNKGLGEAVYRVELPGPKAGTALILRFGTTITGPTDDGVRMSVAVNGKELWSETQVRKGQPHQGMVDLSAYAGQSIRLALRVDARGNNAGDWSNWLRPVILAEVKGEGRQ
jgi:hypothetical protein